MGNIDWVLIISQIIGIAAVALYLLSFQLKRRGQIVGVTCLSYLFYVVQYLMLRAFSGAVLDILSGISSFFAGKKNAPRFRRYAKWVAAAIVAAIIVAGLVIALVRREWIELLPIAGAVLQAGGLWFNKEQTIRAFGLAGAPFWLVYNFETQAYGAAVGAALTVASSVIAIVRYRRKENKDS